MISFFRKLRRTMLGENRFAKYLLYAVGEIVLVVIGILIALQINTWKSEKLERNLEQNLISRLHVEFSENLTILKERIQEVETIHASSLEIINIIEKEELPSDRTLDSLLYYTIEYFAFIPNSNTISEITQTGKISILQDQHLKNKILEWTRQLNSHNDTYKLFEHWIEEEYIIYLTNNISMKNLDKFGMLGWKKDSKFSNDYDLVFKSRTFENIVDNHLYHISILKDHHDKLESIIHDIIILTKENEVGS